MSDEELYELVKKSDAIEEEIRSLYGGPVVLTYTLVLVAIAVVVAAAYTIVKLV